MGGSASAGPKSLGVSPTTSVEVIEYRHDLAKQTLNKALNEAMKEVKLNNPP
jgi:hypothetical protein